MKILLLQPRHNYFMLSPPLGLGYLSSFLKKKAPDNRVEILDLAVDGGDLSARLRQFDPDLIGVTCTTTILKSFSESLSDIKRAAPQAKIVVGGPHISADFEEVLRSLPADIAVIGEGEEVFFQLVSCLREGSDLGTVEGIAYKKNGNVIKTAPARLIEDLDVIPFPDRSLYDLRRYPTEGTMMTSRGCPFRCIFCFKNFGRTWRGHSPDYVFDEISDMYRRHGIRIIRVMDDNPLLDKKRMLKICDLLLKSGLHKKISLELNSGTRADSVDEEMFVKLKEVGLRVLWFGLESADENVLRGMKKDITLAQVADAVGLSKKFGFIVNLFITIGMPFDTLDANRRTAEFVRSLNVDLVMPGMATPYPGTELSQWVDANGRWLNRDYHRWFGHMDVDSSIVYDTPEFTAAERKQAFILWNNFIARRRILNAFKHPLLSVKFAMRHPEAITDTVKKILIK